MLFQNACNDRERGKTSVWAISLHSQLFKILEPEIRIIKQSSEQYAYGTHMRGLLKLRSNRKLLVIRTITQKNGSEKSVWYKEPELACKRTT